MEGLLILVGGIYGLLIVIGLPLLLFGQSGLRRRVGELETQLRAMQEAAHADKPRAQAHASVTDEVIASVAPQAVPPVAEVAEVAEGEAGTEEPGVLADSAEEAPQAPAAPPPVWKSKKPLQPGDIAAAMPRRGQPEAPQEPSRNYVFNERNRAALGAWLQDNWVLAVAALSLALAGVFMVQYGVENGLLTPFWRVMGALGLGAALIGGGEVIRRSAGDEEGATRHLPSTLSGAGLFSLFAGVLAARGLYGLIGAETALLGLVAVSALAVLLGWFYGPVLAAVGIIGGTAAPFLVGGQSDAPWVFYYYFALIALAGLAVDTVKRWAWVSAVVLIVTSGAAWMLYLGGAGDVHFLGFFLIALVGATAIPVRSLVPGHNGPTLLAALAQRAEGEARRLPDFPTRLVAGMMAMSSFAGWRVVVGAGTTDMELLGLIFLTGLMAMAVVWMRHAPALVEMPVLPGGGFLAALVMGAVDRGPLYRAGLAALERAPETAPPMTYTILTIMGAIGSVLLFWRMVWDKGEGQLTQTLRAMSAAVFLPVAVLILSMLWQPEVVLGQYGWALHVIAAAALLTLLAERTARIASPDRMLRVGMFAVGALVLIALALFLLLTKDALTLALGVMLVAVVLLDRKFDLPLLGWFVQLGVVVIGYRLIVDPGVDRALYQPVMQMVLTYGGTLALMAAAWWLAAHRKGSAMRVMLESGCWTLAGVFANLVLIRAVGRANDDAHWALGPMAAIWLGSAVNQVYRLRIGSGLMGGVRRLLAGVFVLVAFGVLAMMATFANPLLNSREVVLGWPFFSSLSVAYLPVAAVLAVAAWKLDNIALRSRKVLAGLSAATVLLWLLMEVRHFWQGPVIALGRGVKDGELYSYTVALLLLSVGLLLLAFARRSVGLRKLAMAGVGLTIAKVFLLDMAGLSGLIRVASFMGLGLSLAALAWLNRVMERQWNKGQAMVPDEGPEDPLA